MAPTMKPLGPRWWFENRETGRITIGQFPNGPLFAIAATWIVRWVVNDESHLHDLAGGAATVLWLYWGSDEVVRGVNPWRRLLGAAVVLWQVSRLL